MVIVPWAIVLDGNCPRGNCSGAEGNWPGGNCPRTGNSQYKVSNIKRTIFLTRPRAGLRHLRELKHSFLDFLICH